MRSWMWALMAAVVTVIVIGGGIVAAVLLADSGTPIVDLEVGDCFVLPDEVDDELVDVDTIDCDEPHDAEVIAVGNLNADGDAPYPDDDTGLFAEIDGLCRAAAARLGPPAESFGLLPVAPTEELWDTFSGRYLCVAIPFGGDLVTGSLVDTADGV